MRNLPPALRLRLIRIGLLCVGIFVLSYAIGQHPVEPLRITVRTAP